MKFSLGTARGPLIALAAAVLFGMGMPFAKWLLHDTSPWLLSGILYLGCGLGMTLLRLLRSGRGERLLKSDMPWLAGAVLAGGVIAPVLLMHGLAATTASSASLLLNAEGVFTALLAWFAFRENVDVRIALGFAAIVAGAVILSWPSGHSTISLYAAIPILAACLAWGIDNNLTRKISLSDATSIAAIKGSTAGAINIVIALLSGATLPPWPHVALALGVGWMSYGVSLALFVIALRELGTARTGAYFSVAPFFGAVLAVAAFTEPVTPALVAAGLMMAIGVWLHVTEQHEHEHTHELLEHSHEHEHDEHHQHEHADGDTGSIAGRHTHWHRHAPLTHTHRHVPDVHHRHDHNL
jgi:drug/metabolite transporter (DMT)-like permease